MISVDGSFVTEQNVGLKISIGITRYAKKYITKSLAAIDILADV